MTDLLDKNKILKMFRAQRERGGGKHCKFYSVFSKAGQRIGELRLESGDKRSAFKYADESYREEFGESLLGQFFAVQFDAWHVATTTKPLRKPKRFEPFIAGNGDNEGLARTIKLPKGVDYASSLM